MVITKEKVLQATHELCKEKPGAVSTHVIYQEMRKIAPTSKETILKLLRELTDDGTVNNYPIGNKQYWCTPDICPELPENISDRILRALREIEDETGKPTTFAKIAEKTGMTADRVRYYIRYDRVVGVNEVSVGNKTMVTLNQLADAPVEEIKCPIRREDIADALLRTRIGDRIMADFPKQKYSDAHRIRHDVRELKVKQKTDKLCVFDTGDAVRWSDIVLYYRSNMTQAIVINKARSFSNE